ncbi:MAG: hypothetical protein KAJ49_03395 [Arcobacteraceae bacterium]|nr:hypothetical protein [Arcobacteraceae bacterium]
MQQLSQNDVADLKREGYSEQEIAEAVKEIQVEEATGMVQPQRQDPRMYAQHSAFAPQFQDNLIKWQLELDNILERCEHILRGDKLVFEQGNLTWQPNIKEEDNILNEYGVAEVMRILSMYLNRNTILSDYDDTEIREKVLDFGRELNDLFYMKYEQMGLVGLEKRKNYPMLIREMVDIVHSSYKRALHGGEKRSLREARSITQTEAIAGGGAVVNVAGQPPQSRGILNPMRYVAGKFK